MLLVQGTEKSLFRPLLPTSTYFFEQHKKPANPHKYWGNWPAYQNLRAKTNGQGSGVGTMNTRGGVVVTPLVRLEKRGSVSTVKRGSVSLSSIGKCCHFPMGALPPNPHSRRRGLGGQHCCPFGKAYSVSRQQAPSGCIRLRRISTAKYGGLLLLPLLKPCSVLPLHQCGHVPDGRRMQPSTLFCPIQYPCRLESLVFCCRRAARKGRRLA